MVSRKTLLQVMGCTARVRLLFLAVILILILCPGISCTDENPRGPTKTPIQGVRNEEKSPSSIKNPDKTTQPAGKRRDSPEKDNTAKQVVLTMGSWRMDDRVEMNRIFREFTAKHPNITIHFDPTAAQDYDEVLYAQLSSGYGPDLFYLRSYSVSRLLYEKGFIEPCENMPEIRITFSEKMLSAWTADDGRIYGVPLIATSHGVYYNKDIYSKCNLQIPRTFEELVEGAKKIQENGYIPFANATRERWTVAEIIFMNLAPGYIGGEKGRKAYLAGKRCFDDQAVTDVYRAMAEIGRYLPANQKYMTYTDSLQLFVQGKAAMWLGGSWDIPYFVKESPDFSWGVFVPPPMKGYSSCITFHLDAGMGLNAKSAHKKEAKLFLKWLASMQFANLLANELPGFFPMHSHMPVFSNPHAKEFYALNQKVGCTDVRFAWEKLREGEPSAYDLIRDTGFMVMNLQITPEDAAKTLQEGLVRWFMPARNCR